MLLMLDIGIMVYLFIWTDIAKQIRSWFKSCTADQKCVYKVDSRSEVSPMTIRRPR